MLSSLLRAATLLLCAALPCQHAEFESAVSPFFERHCHDCHGEERQKGGIDLRDFAPAITEREQAEQWLLALRQLQTGLMPPRSRRRPDAGDRRRAIRWIEDAVLTSPFGATHRATMAMPEYGNWVDHHTLFSGEIDEPPFTRARLWRRSPHQFAARRGLNRAVKGVQNPFVFATPVNGVRDYAATSHVGASVVETSLVNAASELDWLLAEAERRAAEPPARGRRQRPDPLVPFVAGDATPSPTQMRAAIEPTFRRLVSRAPTEAELDKYVALLQQNLRDTGDPRASLRATLMALYVSPEALYRIEWGNGPIDEHGRRLLGPEELAHALSYALFDTGPFDGRGKARWIAEALEHGELQTQAHVRKLVDRILTGEEYWPKSAKRHYDVPRVMRFFREFFGYDRATEVFKDAGHVDKNGMRHDPRRLEKDAENLIGYVLRRDENVFEQLLTTNLALVFHDGDNQAPIARWEKARQDLANVDEAWARQQTERRLKGIQKKPKYRNNPPLLARAQKQIRAEEKTLAEKERARLQKLVDQGPHMQKTKWRDRRYVLAYNLDPKSWEWPAEQPFELPPEQRAGLLTHPAWLVTHSGNFDTDPIHRGIWVYEKLLAGVIGDVPPDVDARIAEDPHRTLRERMAPLRERACWKCHHKINPLGEAFEVFDDFGRYRDRFHVDDEGALVGKPAATTRPVDASGTFDDLALEELGLGDADLAKLRGEFDSAIPMLRRIATTDRARQSFLRHLFRFFLGRNETLADSRTLRAIDRAYQESGGSLRATLVALLSSDSFLYRR